MKKLLTTTMMALGLSVVMFGTTGCSSKNPNIQIDDKKSILNNAPEWVGDPKLDGYIVEVGSATQNSKDDIGFQRAEAMADARNNLAKLLKIEIKHRLESQKNKDDKGELTERHEHTSTQIAEVMVRMSTQQKIWVAENGQMFLLVGIEKSTLDSNINKNILKQ